MSDRPSDLPEFDRPPVAEVALGVQFKTDSPLRVPHFGLFWKAVREDFPAFREHPPLSSQIEELEPEPPKTSPQLGIHIGTGPPPAPRCWFIDASENKLIQLQTDRFLHNWRKVTGDEAYPRYEVIWNEFIARWQVLVSFLAEQDLGTPTVTQAEVTYVNHIPQGSCWNSADDMKEVFSVLKPVNEADLFGPMETMEFGIRRRLPDNRGRLHVTAAPVFHTKDNTIMIRMVLTARGPVPNSSDEAILEWMQIGRSAIVKSFTALTTPAAHEFWGRTK